MQLDIQARDFSLTDALSNYANQRLRMVISGCDNHITRVVMRLSDINGPRGGDDKRCLLRVVLAGQPDVVVEDVEADLYDAIDRATERARRSVNRKIARRRYLDSRCGARPKQGHYSHFSASKELGGVDQS